MKLNPVYLKESKTSSRTVKTAVIILLFNGVLAAVAFLNLYSMVESLRYTGEVQFSSMLELYMLIAEFEFAMLLLVRRKGEADAGSAFKHQDEAKADHHRKAFVRSGGGKHTDPVHIPDPVAGIYLWRPEDAGPVFSVSIFSGDSLFCGKHRHHVFFGI